MQNLICNTWDCVEAFFKNSPNIQDLETPSVRDFLKQKYLITEHKSWRGITFFHIHLILFSWTVTKSCCPVFLKNFQRFLTGDTFLTCSKRNNCAINLELVITHDIWIMLLKGVFLPALYLLVNNNSPNYRYKSVEVWMHSWKWWKCLIKYVPETEDVIRFSMLTMGFFGSADRTTDPPDGNTRFIRMINLKGGKTLSLVIIIVPRDLSNQWGIKILFSYTSSYGLLQQGRAYIICPAYKQQTFNYFGFQVKFYEDTVIFSWFEFVTSMIQTHITDL